MWQMLNGKNVTEVERETLAELGKFLRCISGCFNFGFCLGYSFSTVSDVIDRVERVEVWWGHSS